MTIINQELSMGDKILLAIFELNRIKKRGEKITKEEMVVKVWKMFPKDFCLKGYPKYPNSDISKYITKLFKENLLKGNFYNYIITSKGEEYAEIIKKSNFSKKDEEIISCSRTIEKEITRLQKSKVFKLYIKNENEEFIESDLFEFLGTSSRSLNDSNKTNFIARYNFIVKEVIPFCERIKTKDQIAEKIINLWNKLTNQFRGILQNK